MTTKECQATALAEILNDCFHQLMEGHPGVPPCEVLTKFVSMNLHSETDERCHCNGIEFVKQLEDELKTNLK